MKDFKKILREKYNKIYKKAHSDDSLDPEMTISTSEIYEHENNYVMFHYREDSRLVSYIWIGEKNLLDINPLEDLDFWSTSGNENWKIINIANVEFKEDEDECLEDNYHELVVGVLENLDYYLEKQNLL